jgi:hypothetical protein
VLGACRARDANALLRLARRHGVTNDRLAYWTGIDPGEISKRLSGKTTSPVQTLDRWERIATGLGMSDPARLAVGLAPGESGPLPIELPPRSSDLPAHVPAVDPQLPATLLDLLTQYVRTDNLLGPRSLLTAVGSQFALIERLWGIARDTVRADLLTVGSRYGEFAGWLHQDAGDSGAATRWTRQALELAHAADSTLLVSYVLMRQSNQASGAGDAVRTLALAGAALRLAPRPAAARAGVAPGGPGPCSGRRRRGVRAGDRRGQGGSGHRPGRRAALAHGLLHPGVRGDGGGRLLAAARAAAPGGADPPRGPARLAAGAAP